jgi:serine/threonine-protein kinase
MSEDPPDRKVNETLDAGSPEALVTARTVTALRVSTSSLVDQVGARYVIQSELGAGGAGRVLEATDNLIGRTVALKILRSGVTAAEDERNRFIEEVRVTGQLEHPSIIPVYDVGSLDDDQPFYTMRVVKRRSLREVLALPSPRHEWSLARLAAVYVQVCRAMSYAHARGVLHRDLKPDNILLGEYGEVYVADWGIAKLTGASPIESRRPASVYAGTIIGTVMGTPGYMPPEQVRGEWATIDDRADLFALGAILYEILTDRQAFDGETIPAILDATLHDTPRRPREIAHACPLVLDDLCMALLEKDPARRPRSAADVAAEVEAFLEGAKERERRIDEAQRLVAQARVAERTYRELGEVRTRASAEAKALRADVKPFEGVDRKRAVWNAEDAARTAAASQAKALAETVDFYSRALGYQADSQDARRGLATLYWSLAHDAARERDEPGRIYYEAAALEYDDGHYASILAAKARVSIRSEPAGAEVLAWRYFEKDRVLQAADPVNLGSTPIRGVELAPGSYVLELRKKGHGDVRHPLACVRNEHHEVAVTLYSDEQIGRGMIYIPGGRSVVGGDDDAFDALSRREVDVEDFAMAELPVTFDEYLEFINDLERSGRADEALARLPQTSLTNEEKPVVRDEQGRWIVWEHIIEGDGREFCPPTRMGSLPVICIDWFDAVQYCRWRGERDGCSYRLPTELEWEKAARGADERLFVWGNRFDATFCKMRDSRPGFSQPEPVGVFPADKSPYGIRDLGGGARCWVADIHERVSAMDALAQKEPPPRSLRDAAGMRMARGGAWYVTAQWCRTCSRDLLYALGRYTFVGIRLAKTLGTT